MSRVNFDTLQNTLFDFIVIGSGVSGGRIARNLSREGAKCLLLEAGKWFKAPSFPPSELAYSSQMYWGGGVEFNSDARLGLLRAKCVGGTSVVNQALIDPFDEEVFSDWKDRSGVDFFELDTIHPYYDRVRSELNVETIAEEAQNRNARLFKKGLKMLGYEWRPLDRAQKDCDGSDCIVCLGGCPRNAKQSTLVTTIPEGVKHGLAVLDQFHVNSVEPQKEAVRVRGNHGGAALDFQAKRLILAAGSLGNSKILLNSSIGKKIPALGKGFYCHPQYMTFARFKRPVDAHKGSFSAVKSEDKKLKRMGFKLENVAGPPIAIAILMNGVRQKHYEEMKPFRHYAQTEICIRDENPGTIKINKNGELIIEKTLSDIDRKKVEKGLDFVRVMYEQTGASQIFSSNQGFGLHLMGGCAIGSDESKAVVSENFSLFADERIFCADSSTFPAAPGINPSFTIMALTEMASDKILKEAQIK